MQRRIWIVILCGGLILTLATGLRATFGLLLKPVSFDLSIGRESFAFGIALQNLLWGLTTPFLGAIADRYGSARVAAAGGAVYAVGLLAMSQATSGANLIFGNVLVGIGLGGAGFSVVLGAVGRFAPPEKRSMALGLCAAGGSFGQFAVVPYGHVLIDAIGWSPALLVLAATALIMVPLSAGIAGDTSRSRAGHAQTIGAALGEAFRHRGFWLLTTGFFVCGFQVVFVATHLPAFLADKGLPDWLGAWALALVGLFNIIGTYGCGMLGARYQKKNVLSALYLARAGVFLLFIAMPLSETSVLIFAAALGLLWLGTVPLTSGLVVHIFGPAYMSMLYGVVFLSHQAGSSMGAWLGGYAYDLTGSYDAMWWLSVALGLIAAALHLPIAERPVPRLATAGGVA
ncbi:MAG: MFS transporter [Rhodospirillales bacterium]|nr:MFS transporter [Rhodospirillales bacterium]